MLAAVSYTGLSKLADCHQAFA